eukprot:g63342.t1
MNPCYSLYCEEDSEWPFCLACQRLRLIFASFSLLNLTFLPVNQYRSAAPQSKPRKSAASATHSSDTSSSLKSISSMSIEFEPRTPKLRNFEWRRGDCNVALPP